MKMLINGTSLNYDLMQGILVREKPYIGIFYTVTSMIFSVRIMKNIKHYRNIISAGYSLIYLILTLKLCIP